MRGAAIRTGWAAVLCAAALSGWTARDAAAAEAPPTDQLLPPETYVFVTCPSVETLKERFNESSTGRLWQDRSMAAFREHIEAQKETLEKEFQDRVGLPLMQVLALPKGETTFAVARGDANQLGSILIADVGEEHDGLEAVLDRIDEALKDAGGEHSTENVNGVELQLFTRRPTEGEPDTMGYYTRETLVVFSTSVALLKGSLSRWDDTSAATFSQNEVYRTIVGSTRESDSEESDLYYFADPVNLIQATLQSNPSTTMQSVLFSANLAKTGLDKLKGIGGAATLSSESFDSVSRTMVYVDQPLTGLLRFFRMPAREQSPPAWVSRNIDQYTGLSWDPEGAYQGIASVYDEVMGQPGGFDAFIEQAAVHPSNPGIHPKKDVFDQMTGQAHVLGDFENSGGTPTQRMVFAIGIKNDVHMQSLLEKLVARAGAIQKRAFEGTTVYEFDLSLPDPEAPSPAFAVNRNFLLVSTHAAALENVLRNAASGSDPLSGAEDYQAVARHFPRQTSSIGFARASAQIGQIWEQARGGEFENQIEGIDFRKLPEFKSVERFFSASGTYIVPVEKGAIFVQFSLPVE
ncbi:MAG: DUF3352 domain-containing protein [Planctomyces sp.]|nr:DUF3352 domain-containing protein [Planctomyces sp.]